MRPLPPRIADDPATMTVWAGATPRAITSRTTTIVGSSSSHIARWDYFISTGEILIPDAELTGSADSIRAGATVDYTFPLRMAEIVWCDGRGTHRRIIPLDRTREFGHVRFEWETEAKQWQWARLAVWDVAGNGAFTNPIWRMSGATKTTTMVRQMKKNDRR